MANGLKTTELLNLIEITLAIQMKKLSVGSSLKSALQNVLSYEPRSLFLKNMTDLMKFKKNVQGFAEYSYNEIIKVF